MELTGARSKNVAIVCGIIGLVHLVFGPYARLSSRDVTRVEVLTCTSVLQTHVIGARLTQVLQGVKR